MKRLFAIACILACAAGLAGCENITGASATSRALLITAGETCERSTIIPSRFISRTTSLPNGVRPLCFGLSVALSAKSLAVAWARVM